MNGCTANVTDSLRRPSFHCPYSTQSAMNISISSWMNACPVNSSTPATATTVSDEPANQNTTSPTRHRRVAKVWIWKRRRNFRTSGKSANPASCVTARMAANTE